MLIAAGAIAFSASPTDDATGHRNCGGSTASFAVCGPNTTGRCASYSIRISVAAWVAWSSVAATTSAIGWPA